MKKTTLHAVAGLLLAPALLLAAETKPVVYDITQLVRESHGRLSMIGSRELSLDNDVPSLNETKSVHFVDLLPRANWSHPAAIRWIGKNGQVLREMKTERPPKGLSEMPVIDGDSLVPPTTELEFKINDLKGSLKVSNPSQRYAILINGHADNRHWNDFSFLYRTLVTVYGYLPQNIWVADSVYKDKKPDLDGNGTADILYSSTKRGIEELLKKAKEKLTKDDYLLLAVNDHGGTQNGESTIILFDGDIKASEFAKLMKDIPTNRVLSVFEQCFSGGFVRGNVSAQRVAMSAATNTEYSWATSDLVFDEFLYHVTSAFARQNHLGAPVNADKNGDGKVSAQEAFAYAVGNDQAPESPLLEAYNNSGDANNSGLNF